MGERGERGFDSGFVCGLVYASGLYVMLCLGFVLNNMQCMYAWERLHTFG